MGRLHERAQRRPCIDAFSFVVDASRASAQDWARVQDRLATRKTQEKMFTLCQHVPVESFKGLQTENVRDD